MREGRGREGGREEEAERRGRGRKERTNFCRVDLVWHLLVENALTPTEKEKTLIWLSEKSPKLVIFSPT
jgi:hypothetical protein